MTAPLRSSTTPIADATEPAGLRAELDLGLGHRYRLDGLLARSTCGDIWQATWLQTGTPVTVKTLRADAPASDLPLHRRSLDREGEHLRRLADRHIVRYQRAGIWRGEPVLVLERLHESLKDHLARRAGAGPAASATASGSAEGVSEQQALAWVRQAALGLHALHRSGRKHLDIKTANLLLSAPDATGQQVLKLADFGACLPVATQEHAFVGTPGWAAPEQLAAAGQDAQRQPLFATSQASDWYALGQLLHRLLTGRLTPEGEAALLRYRSGGLAGLCSIPLPVTERAEPKDNDATWYGWSGASVNGADQSGKASGLQVASTGIEPQQRTLARFGGFESRKFDASAIQRLLCSHSLNHRHQGAALLLAAPRRPRAAANLHPAF